MNILTILFFGFFSLTSFCNGLCIERERQALLKLKQSLVDPAHRLASWSADNGDCCRWKGIVCHNLTGHVLQLHLSAPTYTEDLYDLGDAYQEINVTSQLRGKISHSLLHLKHLSYLNLSHNDFRGIQIPKFFGSLRSLRRLDLSSAGFVGEVPQHLRNLSNLLHLNLSNNHLHVENLHWLSGLSSLEQLDLSSNNLSMASNWFHLVNTLPSLVELHLARSHLPLVQVNAFPSVNLSSLSFLDLSWNNFVNLSTIKWVFGLKHLAFLDLSYNSFNGPIPSSLQNLTFLRHIDLSFNSFNSSIPDWFYTFSPLKVLNLRFNNLEGQMSNAIGDMNFVVNLDFSENSDLKGKIPMSMGNLCSLRSISFSGVNLSQEISDVLKVFSGCVSNALQSLDLSNCQLSGQLTDQLTKFKNLRKLFLGSNKLKGNLPKSFGKLSNLEQIDISNNRLEGTICEIHFGNLTKLKSFIGFGNSIILKVHPDWVPPFQIQTLRLGSWLLRTFPNWIHSQKHLRYLDISNSKISDTIPNWFWEFSSQFIYLNLSHNQFQGPLQKILNGVDRDSLPTIDFSSNNFSGPLPLISSNVSLLDLSNNGFSGPITHFLCHKRKETMAMKILKLGKNDLSGELPECWTKWPSLTIIILDNNAFSGGIPSSIGTLQNLSSLHLHKNSLSGGIPISLRNCTKLQILDLSENKLDENIPPWIGISLTKLIILSLRSNKFWGHISKELCALSSLQILDFAHNNLSGSIPRCIGNLSAMVMDYHSSRYNFESYFVVNYVGGINFLLKTFADQRTYFLEDVFVVKKGQVLDYSKTLYLVKVMDFSSNNLSGEIPSEITILNDLQSLNLSHNFFSGRIPGDIGSMRMLESLDLSVNELSGSIPQSMANLTFLGCLNLSNNRLSGRIPSSTQLQSFNASSYVGNKLCGPPLMYNCSEVGSKPDSQNRGGRGEDHGAEINWFFVSLALGFIVVFWSFLSPLVINRRWRYRYYQFLDDMWWKISDFACACF
ncbi:hypothetical protein SLE2022_095020 [Rubroshorea leprosula]